ncbi:hypothetical protein PHPALM_32052, partial [Phytophthora palmivora]
TARTLFASGTIVEASEEFKPINDLYADAVAKGGGRLGPVPWWRHSYSANRLHDARFPGINFTVVVDYSKYHDARIDNLETDALMVISLSDKPANFSKIHDPRKDTNNVWMAFSIYSFGFIFNTKSHGTN